MLLIGLRTRLLAEGALLVFGVQAVVHYVLRVHLLVLKQDELCMHLRRSPTPLSPQHSVLHSALHLVGGTEDSDAMPRLSHLGLTSARPDVMLEDRVAGSWFAVTSGTGIYLTWESTAACPRACPKII